MINEQTFVEGNIENDEDYKKAVSVLCNAASLRGNGCLDKLAFALGQTEPIDFDPRAGVLGTLVNRAIHYRKLHPVERDMK